MTGDETKSRTRIRTELHNHTAQRQRPKPRLRLRKNVKHVSRRSVAQLRNAKLELWKKLALDMLVQPKSC